MNEGSRTFPLADVLSVTTPHLLSRRLMQGVCDLVEWMTDADAATPRWINLSRWNRLKLQTATARTSILRQLPQLVDVRPPAGLDNADLYAWLVDAERRFGETVQLKRAEEEMTEISRAAIEMVRAAGKVLVPPLQELGESMRQVAEAMTAAVRPIAERCEALAQAVAVAAVAEDLGSITGMQVCRCLCFAAHPATQVCDPEAPRALLTLEQGDGVRDILMCRPCAEAAGAAHPRAHGFVVLD